MSDEEKRLTTTDEDEDNEIIADMNVDGMPWYVPGDETKDRTAKHEQMTKEELRMYRWAAVKSGLLIALIFGAVFFLFILFLDFVVFGNRI